jgi:hypothetical protein
MSRESPTDFFFSVNCRKVFRARSENRRKSWLKQLWVAVSTEASLPVGSSPQKSKTNFVDLRDDDSNFQKPTKISPKNILDRNTRTVNFVNMPSKFSCKTAR